MKTDITNLFKIVLRKNYLIFMLKNIKISGLKLITSMIINFK